MSVRFTIEAHPGPVSRARRAEILRDPKFGQYFTDHMARVVWTEEDGWGDGAIVPFAPSPCTRPPPSCTTRRRSSRA